MVSVSSPTQSRISRRNASLRAFSARGGRCRIRFSDRCSAGILSLFGELTRTDSDTQPTLLSRLQAVRQLWANDVVIFDPFSDVLLYYPTAESLAAKGIHRRAVQRIRSFFRRIVATGTTAVLLVSPNGLPTETVEPLRAVGDVLLDMTVDNAGSRQYRWTMSVDLPGWASRPPTGVRFRSAPALASLSRIEVLSNASDAFVVGASVNTTDGRV